MASSALTLYTSNLIGSPQLPIGIALQVFLPDYVNCKGQTRNFSAVHETFSQGDKGGRRRCISERAGIEAEVSECEIGQAITNRMNAFLNRHRAEFERVGDARTAGILLRHSVLGWSKSSRRISWVHKYGIRPVPGGGVAGVGAVRLMERALEVALTL